ncbi:hypothetical protein IAQ61_012009 [Plenodomus lingam]|uniref:uncharacterized protein n=1 Tax=Leptosphaeria maculans TaxID=5022 RepID=UPI00331CF7FC|nr:hypothetical protein IAQ61_012009 [Plenodomus lingam]
MSHQSPSSSAGMGASSSPFAGTEATLYSPDMARNVGPGHHGRNNSQVTVIATEQSLHRGNGATEKQKAILPLPGYYMPGRFVSEISEDSSHFVSRYLFISRLPDGTPAGSDLEIELFTVQHQMKLVIHLRFDDLQDAIEAREILEQHDFVVDHITNYDYANAKGQDTALVDDNEGQVKVTIKIEPKPDQANFSFSNEDLDAMMTAVGLTAGIFGTLRNCVHVGSDHAQLRLEFRLEFMSLDAAQRAVQSLRLDPVWGMSDDVSLLVSSLHLQDTDPSQKTFQWFTVDVAPWVGGLGLNAPQARRPMDNQGRLLGYRPATSDQQEPRRVAHPFRHPHDQHNRVRRERILDGGDVRTTIMLRNIPNKLDWNCFGTYDFMYLRIDFKTGCNVGYAFINFSDVRGMIALVDKIEGHGWTSFHSAKAAEISYATIQGREALVGKFRNSSVMQETPFCRPRLFCTYAEADIMGALRNSGTEQAFPRPDNLSKLQRSMDSARSIGLYPPHGTSDVTEHRTRTSTYDRGTPRDMIQTAADFARQRLLPMPFNHLPESKKREIEAWYSYTAGQGQLGRIPFEYIPLTHVNQYFALGDPVVPQAHGVVGGPVGGPSNPFI